MDFGISLSASADSWRIVKRAEELGLSHAWFVDTQLLNADPLIVMAAAAMMTSSIRLGTGMLIPSNRMAPVTANALATLNKLAPGRINMGIATGNTARRSMGVGPIKLDELADHIRVIRGMWAGETVDFNFEGVTRKIRFLNPELELINIDDPIGIFVSALGPRGRRMVADLGVNWTIPVGNVGRAIGAIEEMRKTWVESGRDTKDLYAVASGGGCVLDAGEAFDSPRAKAQAGPGAAMFLHDLAEVSVHGDMTRGVPAELIDAYQEIYAAFEPADARYLESNRGHLMVVRPNEEHLVTAELIKMMTLTGTASELRDNLRDLRDAGFTQFTTHVRYGQEEMLERWVEVFESV